jgi:hypothetical protein
MKIFKRAKQADAASFWHFVDRVTDQVLAARDVQKPAPSAPSRPTVRIAAGQLRTRAESPPSRSPAISRHAKSGRR